MSPRMSPRGWTLRTKLLTSIVGLYLLVTLVTGAATVLTSWRAQLDQIDSSLVSAAATIEGDDDGGGRGRPGPPPAVGLGQLTCTVAAETGEILTRSIDGETASTCYVTGTDGDRTEVTQAQIDPVTSMSYQGAPVTVEIAGVSYRVVLARHSEVVRSSSGATQQDVTEVRGLPLAPVQDSMERLIRTVVLVSLFGLLLIALAAWLLVRRNLAPLRRVAATAQRVTTQPLSEGDVRTAERVDRADIDPHTEVGQVGSALNELLDHVDASLGARHRSEQQVRQFVADASHELRTPLASIKGYAELSRRQPDPVPETVTHALGRIESEADRMAGLVEDLLLLARLDAGRPLAQEPVDLTQVVLETVSDAGAAGRDHRFELELPDEPTEVVGDEARLRQVLINLLGNARAHTPAGTRVITAIRPLPDAVELSVTDDGPGIPPERLPHVFERFVRGDEARHRSSGSTGLGLAIVDAVVTAHGGTVDIDSRPGWTRFSVRLPAPGAAAGTRDGSAGH